MHQWISLMLPACKHGTAEPVSSEHPRETCSVQKHMHRTVDAQVELASAFFTK